MSAGPDEVGRLERLNHELEGQLRALVRSEQRFHRTTAEIDRQLRRIVTLNRFALGAGATLEPQRILRVAAEMALELFPIDGAVGFLARDDGMMHAVEVVGAEGIFEGPVTPLPRIDPGDSIVPKTTICSLAAARVAGGMTADLAQSVEGLFRKAWGAGASGDGSLFVIQTSFRSDRRVLGALVMRVGDPEGVGAFERAPGEEDRAFIELFGVHLETALENAVLHQEVAGFAVELEARVLERTKELAETNARLDRNLRRLQDTQAELLHTGRMAAVGTLVAGLSHELSKPTMIIQGYAQTLLEEPPEDPARRKALTVIERQASRCADLIEALLDFSRKGPVEREEATVQEIVERVLSLARGHAEARKVTLALVPIADDLPTLHVSRTEVETAILNIVQNAVDASPDGAKVHLDVSRERREDEDGVVIRVRDAGEGIPPSVRDQIFDPFFTTKPVGRGVGLGLSLANRIVESHRGTIEVDSEAGRGTEMRVWLPAR